MILALGVVLLNGLLRSTVGHIVARGGVDFWKARFKSAEDELNAGVV